MLIQPTCDCFFFGFYHPFYFLKKHPVDHVHIYTYIHTVHYIALHYITLHYVTLHYITYHTYIITLHYITYHTIPYLHYITLHCIALHIYIYNTYLYIGDCHPCAGNPVLNSSFVPVKALQVLPETDAWCKVQPGCGFHLMNETMSEDGRDST